MKKKEPCAIKSCHRFATARSSWCQPCRQALYYWMKLSPAQRERSQARAALRSSRVWIFGHNSRPLRLAS